MADSTRLGKVRKAIKKKMDGLIRAHQDYKERYGQYPMRTHETPRHQLVTKWNTFLQLTSRLALAIEEGATSEVMLQEMDALQAKMDAFKAEMVASKAKGTMDALQAKMDVSKAAPAFRRYWAQLLLEAAAAAMRGKIPF